MRGNVRVIPPWLQTFVQTPQDDHWQQLGVGGALAIAVLAVVLNFVLKFVAIRKDATLPALGLSHGNSHHDKATNGKSGDRSTDFWANSIAGITQAALDRTVVPKLDALAQVAKEMTVELRAIRETLADMKPRRR